MNHPKVPPNSPFFPGASTVFELPLSGDFEDRNNVYAYVIRDAPNAIRKIIAAVAMAELKRLQSITYQKGARGFAGETAEKWGHLEYLYQRWARWGGWITERAPENQFPDADRSSSHNVPPNESNT